MILFKTVTKRTSFLITNTITEYNWRFEIIPSFQVSGFGGNKKSFGISVAWLCFDIYFWFTWTKLFKEDENIEL